MLNEMMQYTIRRTDAGRFVTVRDISKRFSVPTAEVITMLTGEISGYTVKFSDTEIKGTTVVTVENIYVDEGNILSGTMQDEATLTGEETSKIESLMESIILPTNYVEQVAATEEIMESSLEPDKAEDDPYAGVEAEIEAHIMPVKASRKVDASYTRYETLEAAEAALGYQLISVAELHKACDRWGVKVNRMVKALGGDRGLGEPRSAAWKPVLVGRSRHVAISCVEDLKNL